MTPANRTLARHEAGAASWFSGQPWLILACVAAVLVASQAVMARLSGGWAQAKLVTLADAAPVVALLGLPGLAGMAGIPLLSRFAAGPLALCVMLGAGLVMRLVWFGVPVLIDDDFFRYLWDGAMLAWGHNPFALPPLSIIQGRSVPPDLIPLVARAGDVLPHINFPEVTTIYPGTAQLAFAFAYWIAPLKIDGLRIVFLAAEVAGVAVLMAIMRDLGRPPIMAALYWLNPLVVWSGYGTIHSEALLVPLLLATMLAAWRAHDVLAAMLLALAVGVKVWPVLLVPLLARLVYARGRSLIWPALAFAVIGSLLLLPLGLAALARPRSGLVSYSNYWWVNNGPFAWISFWVYEASGGHKFGQQALRVTLAAAVGALALWVARRPPSDFRDFLTAATCVAAATFYAAPAQFPWYALWFLGFAAAIESRPLLLASATLAIYHFHTPLANQGIGFRHSYGLAFVHALPVWAWLLWEWRQSRRASSADLQSA